MTPPNDDGNEFQDDSSHPQKQQLEKSAELLDENLFWKLVDKSLANSNNQHEQEEFLVKELLKLTPKQMIGFRLRTDQLLFAAYTSELWCAAYIMNGFCSDDGFEYFRNWLISRGKETYYKAKENPDYLINEAVEGVDYYEFEGFWYVALQAFELVTGEDLYDYIDEENFQLGDEDFQFQFTWEENDPESMKKICPALFAKMWKQKKE